MSYCPNCGTELQDALVAGAVCPSCGTAFPQVEVDGLDIFEGGSRGNTGEQGIWNKRDDAEVVAAYKNMKRGERKARWEQDEAQEKEEQSRLKSQFEQTKLWKVSEAWFKRAKGSAKEEHSKAYEWVLLDETHHIMALANVAQGGDGKAKIFAAYYIDCHDITRLSVSAYKLKPIRELVLTLYLRNPSIRVFIEPSRELEAAAGTITYSFVKNRALDIAKAIETQRFKYDPETGEEAPSIELDWIDRQINDPTLWKTFSSAKFEVKRYTDRFKEGDSPEIAQRNRARQAQAEQAQQEDIGKRRDAMSAAAKKQGLPKRYLDEQMKMLAKYHTTTNVVRIPVTVIANGKVWMEANRLSYDQNNRLQKLARAKMFEEEAQWQAFYIDLNTINGVEVVTEQNKRTSNETNFQVGKIGGFKGLNTFGMSSSKYHYMALEQLDLVVTTTDPNTRFIIHFLKRGRNVEVDTKEYNDIIKQAVGTKEAYEKIVAQNGFVIPQPQPQVQAVQQPAPQLTAQPAPQPVQQPAPQPSAQDVSSQLIEYKKLLDAGIITDAEFTALKKKLLGI